MTCSRSKLQGQLIVSRSHWSIVRPYHLGHACLGSIAVHDIRCTTVMPFIKDCLTEAILMPHMNSCSEGIAGHEKNDNMLPRSATMTYMVPL
jgi:hypothetical protein